MRSQVDVLHALFILKANSLGYETYTKLYQDDIESFMYFMNFHYSDLFTDRAIAEEEYLGWVHDQASINLHQFSVWSLPCEDYSKKIKFRFVEDV